MGGGTITGYQHQEGLLALSSAPPTRDIWISHFHMDVYGYNGYMYRVIFFTGPPLNSLSMEIQGLGQSTTKFSQTSHSLLNNQILKLYNGQLR